MNEFNRSNKSAGIYWLKNKLEDLVIKITLQPQDNISVLPRLEDYVNNLTPRLLVSPPPEEYTFKWQEKAFSKWEINRYKDVHNCLSETELKYHETLQNNDYEPSKVSTYIHEDYHAPLPSTGNFKKTNDIPFLNNCFQRLHLSERIDKTVVSSSSMSHLFRSEENLVEDAEQWVAMHIVFDKSDYNEDSALLLKQEAPLLSLFHNQRHNYLIISPDVTDLELNPYVVEPMTGVQWGYKYSVDIDWDVETGTEMLEFLKRLYAKWEKKHNRLIKFISPEIGRKQARVSFEILTASGFENDNSYIEFTVKIPDSVKSEGPLHGRTHCTKALVTGDHDTWQYGHLVDLDLEMDDDLEPKPLIIYLEMISTDWWGRHRTEGYTYLPLTLEPGYFKKELLCMRPDEMNNVTAAERRFFVGGCNLLKDLDVLSEPHLYDAKFKYTTTGCISVRWSTLVQYYMAGLSSSAEPRSGSSSDVLQAAEAVLNKYKLARARLQAVTTGFNREDED